MKTWKHCFFVFLIIFGMNVTFISCASLPSDLVLDELNGIWVRQKEGAATLEPVEFQFSGNSYLLRVNNADNSRGGFEVTKHYGSNAIKLNVGEYVTRDGRWNKGNRNANIILPYMIRNGDLVIQGNSAFVGTYKNTSPSAVTYTVIGNVTASWTSFNFLHISGGDSYIREKALSLLRKEAERQGFSGNYEIKIVSVNQVPSPFTIFLFAINAVADIRITQASGAVVTRDIAPNRQRR